MAEADDDGADLAERLHHEVDRILLAHRRFAACDAPERRGGRRMCHERPLGRRSSSGGRAASPVGQYAWVADAGPRTNRRIVAEVTDNEESR